MFVFPLKTSLVGCLWIVLSLFDIVKNELLFLKWEWILYFRVAFGLSYCFRDVFGMCSGCVRDVFGMQVFVENKQDRCLFTKLKKCIFPLLSLLQNLPLAYFVATQQSKNVLLLCFRCSKIWYSARIALSLHKI